MSDGVRSGAEGCGSGGLGEARGIGVCEREGSVGLEVVNDGCGEGVSGDRNGGGTGTCVCGVVSASGIAGGCGGVVSESACEVTNDGCSEAGIGGEVRGTVDGCVGPGGESDGGVANGYGPMQPEAAVEGGEEASPVLQSLGGRRNVGEAARIEARVADGAANVGSESSVFR